MPHELENSAAISAYSVGDEIESLCHAYVKQHDQGAAPAIEAVLAKIAPEHQGRLLVELIPADMERRFALGENPTIKEYEERFPEHRAQIAEVDVYAQRTKAIQLDSSMPKLDRRHAVGQHLAHFVLVKRVGAGTYGEVWQAMDTSLTRTVALKIPRAAFKHHVGVGSLQREGQAAAQLKHANIVTIFGIEQADDLLLIASEFIDGPSLKVWLKRKRPSYATIAQLCAKLAEGLDHAHDRGVIHRDLKPSNVLMDADDEPYITDFGLAKNFAALDSATTDGEIMGTPAYMSPEQAQGKAAYVDGRADVFALGVMLYEMLTRRLPFDGERQVLLNSIIHKDPTKPRAIRKDIPRDLETICLKALEKEPSRRYASAQEMAVDLRRFLRGDAIIARPTKLPERAWRYVKKYPARIAAIALSLVAMLALGAALNLAQTNKQLLGLRPVSITTNPPGARIALAPPHPVTGEPDESRVIFAPTRSPVQLDLAPGDYFVVALLDDGRFHEVYRHVPEKHETVPFAYRHNHWEIADDGTVTVPEVDIPPLSVTDEMATFAAFADLKMQVGSRENSPIVTMDVAEFHLDRREFTAGDFTAFYPRNDVGRRMLSPHDDQAAIMYYDWALAVAERHGKRLPWEREFVRAARAEDFTTFASQADAENEEMGGNFPPVGEPAFDRIADSQGGYVWGLRSNVAEWTATQANFQLPQGEPTAPVIFENNKTMWVRGGDSEVVEGSPTIATPHRNPENRVGVERYRTKPGVGWRGGSPAAPFL